MVESANFRQPERVSLVNLGIARVAVFVGIENAATCVGEKVIVEGGGEI